MVVKPPGERIGQIFLSLMRPGNIDNSCRLECDLRAHHATQMPAMKLQLSDALVEHCSCQRNDQNTLMTHLAFSWWRLIGHAGKGSKSP
jgi:hypothetical protein